MPRIYGDPRRVGVPYERGTPVWLEMNDLHGEARLCDVSTF